MSSPRGFVVGGIDGIGTVEDDRFPNRVGEGDLARLGGADLPENDGREKKEEMWSNGDLRGAWRMLRYMLKLRSARFTRGT